MVDGNIVGSPQKELELEELHKTIDDTLKKVCRDPKEIKIMKQRYGLEDGKPRTLESIAQNNKVTRERIRQIQKNIEKKMKHYLKDYQEYHFQGDNKVNNKIKELLKGYNMVVLKGLRLTDIKSDIAIKVEKGDTGNDVGAD